MIYSLADQQFSCLSTLGVAGYLLGLGLRNRSLQSRYISHSWEVGYGAVSIESLAYLEWPGTTGLHLSVVVANWAQAILSLFFLI